MDIKAGVSGAGREATEETHYVSAVDNVNAYKVEGHRHTAELEQELPGVHFSFVCPPAADRPGDPRQLLRHPRRGADGATRSASCIEAPTRTSRSWSVVGRAAAHARRARHQPRDASR